MTASWQENSDYESDPSILQDEELVALAGAWLEQRSEIIDSTSLEDFGT